MMTEWLLRAVLASVLVGVSALAADEAARLLRRPRRWVWAAALGGSVLLPVLAWRAPLGWSDAILQRIRGVWPAWDTPAIGRTGIESGAMAVDSAPALSQAASVWTGLAGPLLALGWLAASTALLAAFLLAYRRLHRAGATAPPARVDDGAPVLVTESAGPAVVGVLRPRVLVPRWVLDEPAEARRLILAHEREHVAARDPLLLAGAAAALVALPWNPVLWWLHRRLRRAVETDCDARVLARGADVRAYGRVLLETTRRAGGVPAPGLAFSKPAYLLERRILAMTDRIPNRRALRIAFVAPTAAVLAALACDAAAPTVPEARPSAESGDGTARYAMNAEAGTDAAARREAAVRLLREAAENRLVMEVGEHVTIRPYRTEDVRSQFVVGGEIPLILESRSRAEQPLIYVDGVRVEAHDDTIRNLDPTDIMRMEVVKGEAARRTEGPEAAHGVIRIFTRATLRATPDN